MLIARYANPRVTMIRGSVSSARTGLRMVFATPRTAEPIRYAAQPWMRTLPHSASAAQSAAALIAHATARRTSHGIARVYADALASLPDRLDQIPLAHLGAAGNALLLRDL